MGKFTLLIVAAAILAGATLKLGMDAIAGDTASGRAEGQADVLARQIAESGQSVALAAMVADNGFINPGDETDRRYEGGTYDVRYANLSADNTEITVTVEGRYGGAVHTIQSTYAFDPMEYPGPIWLDVPYATANIANGSTNRVSGTMNDHPVQYDQRKFNDLGLSGYGMNRGTMESHLQGQLGRAGGTLSSPDADQWAASSGQPGPLTEDLSQDDSVVDAEGLYQAALSSMDAGDRTFATKKTVGGNETWGGAERVTRVQGDLTVRGRLSGSGVLLVEGVLEVMNTGGARLDWDGIVIVRADQQLLPVKLNGAVDIAGGLVVVQNAFPPGGHMDLTVMRAETEAGMGNNPVGLRPSPTWPTPVGSMDYQWYEHTHRFDLEPEANPRGGHVEFARDGRGAQEAETQFWTTVRSLGALPVSLEFRNAGAHGFSRFTLGLAGQPTVTGAVRSGFGPVAAPYSRFRTQQFPANTLRTLTLDVQSLRALKSRFDGEGSCLIGGYRIESWPSCIGSDWNRQGALSVRLLREEGARPLYEASLYWHMKSEERVQHDAEEAAWLATLAAGGSFGTHLEMGPNARVTYRHANIVRLADKLDFDGNEVRLVSSVSEHVSAAELRANPALGAPAPSTLPPGVPTPGTPPTGPTPGPTPGTPTMPTTPTGPATTPTPAGPAPAVAYPVCHNGSTLILTNKNEAAMHTGGHGDAVGACPDVSETSPADSYAPPPDWNPTFYVCHQERDGKVKSKKVNNQRKYEEHVTQHRDPIRVGRSCPRNGDDDDDDDDDD